jgi:RNA-splicing ligase RtcB
MSRSKAKANIALEDFQKIMKKNNVWSSCINEKTLDEAPQAYKKAADIIKYLEPTVDIKCHMKPVYNFKGN